MLSSGDVASLFAAQNAQFMGMSNYATQMSMPPPSLMGGVGAMPPPYPSFGRGFSYGRSGFDSPAMGFGNRMSSMAVSAMGAGMTLGGLGMGALSMMPQAGHLGMLVDPISAGIWGFGRAGIMGAAGAAAVPLGLAAGAGMFGQNFIAGAQQQMAVNSMLGQNFNMFNPMARGGFGFSRDQMFGIGSQMRQMANMPSMLTSAEELNSLIPMLQRSGTMQGVKDATEFGRRFREAVTTIREVSKVLGSTMQEASEFFAQSRAAGFLGKNDQIRNALNMRFTSGVTGMSEGQFVQMQSFGANLGTSLGTSRRMGAQAVTNLAQTIGLAQRSGRISEDLITDISGVEGPEGVRIASQLMAEKLAAVGRGTAVGRLMMAGAVKFDENGRALGLDEDIMRGVNEGTIGVEDLKRRASRLTARQKVSFARRQERLSLAFAGSGAGALGTLVGGLKTEFGEEGTGLILERQGLNDNEADLAMGLGGFNESGERSAMSRILGQESRIAERSPDAIWRRMKTKLRTTLFSGVQEAGARMSNAIGKAVDDAVDDFVGRHVTTITKQTAVAVERAMGGSGGGNREIKEMFDALRTTNMNARSPYSTGNLSRLGMIGLGTAVGFGVGGPLGALALGGGLAATGAFDEFGAMIDRSSTGGIAKFLTGSRSAEDMGRYLGGLLGTNASGLTGALASYDQGGPLRNKLSSTETEHLSRIMSELYAANPGLMDQAADDQLETLRSAISSGLGLNREDRLWAMTLMGKARGMVGGDAATALIAAGQAGLGKNDRRRISFSGMSSSASWMSASMIRALDVRKKQAEKQLDDAGLSGATLAMIKDNPDLREALHKGLQDGTVERMIMEGDTAGLAKRGINVSFEQVDSLQRALADAKHAQQKGSNVTGSIDDLVKAEKAQGAGAVLSAFQNASAEIAKNVERVKGGLSSDQVAALKAVSDSMANVVNARTGEEGIAALDASGDAIAKVTKMAMGMTEDQRATFLSGLGSQASAVTRGLGSVRGLRAGGRIKASDLTKKFGLSDDVANAVMGKLGNLGALSGDTINLTGKAIEEIAGGVARQEESRSMARAGDKATSDDNNPLIATLTKIDKNMDIMATMLVEGKSREEAVKLVGDRNKATSGSRPVANGSNSGATTFPPQVH